jgi:hypothetical protein
MGLLAAMLPGTGRWPARFVGALFAPWRRGFEEFLFALDRATAGRSGPATLARLLGWTLLAWWIYVPVHELLHALGCAAAGGSVGRLWIQPRY